MDFINEKNILTMKVGKQGGQIPGTFNGGAGGYPYAGACFRGNDMSQGSFAQAGRSVEQYVIRRLAPPFSRGDSYI